MKILIILLLLIVNICISEIKTEEIIGSNNIKTDPVDPTDAAATADSCLKDKKQSCSSSSSSSSSSSTISVTTNQYSFSSSCPLDNIDVKVFTVATEENEGYLRYIKSAKHYDIEVETLGMGGEWLGGDMRYKGGGYKLVLLKEALKDIKDTKKLILFTDSYDVMFLSTMKEIIAKFEKFNANILFGAENYCWPDDTLKHVYPNVDDPTDAKYLNSGLFIGYASDLYEMLKKPINNIDDDQLYFTKIYLDEQLRKQLNIKLDHKSEIFQNLNGAGSVRIENDNDSGLSYIKNIESNTIPSIVHGNGPSKTVLNIFASYVAGNWENGKCKTCDENIMIIDDADDSEKLPIVTLAIFIERPMPFMEEFFDTILAINYPKNKLILFLRNNVPYHNELVAQFIEKFGKEYKTVKQITPTDEINEAAARNLALTMKGDYLFVVDAEARIDNPMTLKELLKYNRNVVAPVLVRPGESWSNFWGALSPQGYYARSHDYMEITKNEIRGIFNVPFISSSYLIKKSIFNKISYESDKLEADMAFCEKLRDANIFMYVINIDIYGHLVNGDLFNPLLKRPDFYMLSTNQYDWESRYIHSEYPFKIDGNYSFSQPCPDVYWFPIATEKFCDDLIEIAEAFGKWSDGTNSDERIQGGYEAVPTRDIHMNQVGLDAIWLLFLKIYVRPLQEAAFTGYYHNPPRSLMNFIVRYKPDEQPALRPHHDSSTYTINIALNRARVDYEGGGCKFIRYNCSVQDTKKGWMLMHPGRLTHLHEGLRTTNGVRYIMISFIDP